MMRQTPYAAARRERDKPQRLVVILPQADLVRIDNWGVAAGKSCRSDAVRDLLNKGLENQERLPLETDQ
jgi:metal-responsive CopG/Arc/MetJ family transcriptional regulator